MFWNAIRLVCLAICFGLWYWPTGQPTIAGQQPANPSVPRFVAADQQPLAFNLYSSGPPACYDVTSFGWRWYVILFAPVNDYVRSYSLSVRITRSGDVQEDGRAHWSITSWGHIFDRYHDSITCSPDVNSKSVYFVASEQTINFSEFTENNPLYLGQRYVDLTKRRIESYFTLWNFQLKDDGTLTYDSGLHNAPCSWCSNYHKHVSMLGLTLRGEVPSDEHTLADHWTTTTPLSCYDGNADVNIHVVRSYSNEGMIAGLTMTVNRKTETWTCTVTTSAFGQVTVPDELSLPPLADWKGACKYVVTRYANEAPRSSGKLQEAYVLTELPTVTQVGLQKQISLVLGDAGGDFNPFTGCANTPINMLSTVPPASGEPYSLTSTAVIGAELVREVPSTQLTSRSVDILMETMTTIQGEIYGYVLGRVWQDRPWTPCLANATFNETLTFAKTSAFGGVATFSHYSETPDGFAACGSTKYGFYVDAIVLIDRGTYYPMIRSRIAPLQTTSDDLKRGSVTTMPTRATNYALNGPAFKPCTLSHQWTGCGSFKQDDPTTWTDGENAIVCFNNLLSFDAKLELCKTYGEEITSLAAQQVDLKVPPQEGETYYKTGVEICPCMDKYSAFYAEGGFDCSKTKGNFAQCHAILDPVQQDQVCTKCQYETTDDMWGKCTDIQRPRRLRLTNWTMWILTETFVGHTCEGWFPIANISDRKVMQSNVPGLSLWSDPERWNGCNQGTPYPYRCIVDGSKVMYGAQRTECLEAHPADFKVGIQCSVQCYSEDTPGNVVNDNRALITYEDESDTEDEVDGDAWSNLQEADGMVDGTVYSCPVMPYMGDHDRFWIPGESDPMPEAARIVQRIDGVEDMTYRMLSLTLMVPPPHSLGDPSESVVGTGFLTVSRWNAPAQTADTDNEVCNIAAQYHVPELNFLSPFVLEDGGSMLANNFMMTEEFRYAFFGDDQNEPNSRNGFFVMMQNYNGRQLALVPYRHDQLMDHTPPTALPLLMVSSMSFLLPPQTLATANIQFVGTYHVNQAALTTTSFDRMIVVIVQADNFYLLQYPSSEERWGDPDGPNLWQNTIPSIVIPETVSDLGGITGVDGAVRTYVTTFDVVTSHHPSGAPFTEMVLGVGFGSRNSRTRVLLRYGVFTDGEGENNVGTVNPTFQMTPLFADGAYVEEVTFSNRYGYDALQRMEARDYVDTAPNLRLVQTIRGLLLPMRIVSGNGGTTLRPGTSTLVFEYQYHADQYSFPYRGLTLSNSPINEPPLGMFSNGYTNYLSPQLVPPASGPIRGQIVLWQIGVPPEHEFEPAVLRDFWYVFVTRFSVNDDGTLTRATQAGPQPPQGAYHVSGVAIPPDQAPFQLAQFRVPRSLLVTDGYLRNRVAPIHSYRDANGENEENMFMMVIDNVVNGVIDEAAVQFTQVFRMFVMQTLRSVITPPPDMKQCRIS